MGRLARLVEADEEILLEARSHWVPLVPSIALTLVALGALGFGLVAWRSAPLWYGGVLGIALIAVVARFTWRFVRWRSTTILITSERVIVRSGVLRRSRRELPLRRIGEVSIAQSLGSRIVGSGTVVIEAGSAGGSMTILHVRRPSRVQRLLYEAIEGQEVGRQRAIPSVVSSVGQPVGVQPIGATYEELLGRGAITHSEYEQLIGGSQPNR